MNIEDANVSRVQVELLVQQQAKRDYDRKLRNAKARARRAALADAMDSVGMVRVRSASGRVYWE